MNLKRAIGFGILLWIFIFVIYSVIMFIPALKGKELAQNIIFWIINIPLVVILAKWYFIKETPSMKKGLFLGIIALATSTFLDIAITVPLFVKSYGAYYTNWTVYAGYAETLILCVIAGGEFDLPVFKREKTVKQAETADGVDKTSKV